MITYEYPFNERIRTLLRLEDLFEKVAYFSKQEGSAESHVALTTVFEVLDVAGRADLKMDMIQELERQRQTLMGYRNNPDISEEALSGALYEIEQSSAALLSLGGRFGQALRDNEWLMSIKSRVAIPGGVCEFDLPAYHYWLNQSATFRRDALAIWLKPVLPVRDALAIILRLLRSSSRGERLLAVNGQFQRMLGGTGAQMVRITLTKDERVIPEVSANRYALNIRFANPPEAEAKAKSCDRDVSFDLTFCNL